MPNISKRRQEEEKKAEEARKKEAESTQEIPQDRTINVTPAWYLDNSRYEIRDGNSFKPYISGKDVFYDIAHSILRAKKSVDIVCTFFDPAMPMVRGEDSFRKKNNNSFATDYDKGNDSGWFLGDTFGNIILSALINNPKLKIRMVIWYNAKAIAFAGPNIIGVTPKFYEPKIDAHEGSTGFDPFFFTNTPPKKGAATYSKKEQEAILGAALGLPKRDPDATTYSSKWFRHVVWAKEGYLDRLGIIHRSINTPENIKEEDGRYPKEIASLAVGCDHQKTVLIDVDDMFDDNIQRNDQADPHGYILGHNYLTQYWTDFPFQHTDERHEMGCIPYHDFSVQVRGPLLIDLNDNFCEAWGAPLRPKKEIYEGPHSQRIGVFGEEHAPKATPKENRADRAALVDEAIDVINTVNPIAWGASGFKWAFGDSPPQRALLEEDPMDLYKARYMRMRGFLLWNNPKKAGEARGQIVRTRPDQLLHGAQEKEIKDAYMKVTRNVKDYILMVNQYCQYSRLARQIKHWKKHYNNEFLACGGAKEKTPQLYIFLGTCKPENHGMLFRTQQMANELGVGEQFETAFDELYDKDTADKDDGDRRQMSTTEMTGDDGKAYPVPALGTIIPGAHITAADMKALHIKPLFFMFYAPLKDENERKTAADHVAQQVYVHAKLMIEDDGFFTLGSANTNIRSFAVDSELNVISDDEATATKLRCDLLKEYVDMDYSEKEFPNKPKVLGQEELKLIYKKMADVAKENSEQIVRKKQIQGLIALFTDKRTANVDRVG